MTTKTLWNLSYFLSIIGIGLAIYLLYYYFASSQPQVCNLGSTINCQAVTKGDLRNFLGLPVALYGLMGYIFIAYASLARNQKLHLAMTSFGLIFCLRLTYLEIFQLKVICPVCLICQSIMFLVFALSIYISYFDKSK